MGNTATVVTVVVVAVAVAFAVTAVSREKRQLCFGDGAIMVPKLLLSLGLRSLGITEAWQSVRGRRPLVQSTRVGPFPKGYKGSG